MILLAVAAIIVVLTVNGDDDSGGTTAEPTTEQSEDPGDEPGDEPSDDPGDDPGDEPGTSGTYTAAPGLCDEMPLDGLTEQDPGLGAPNETVLGDTVTCDLGSDGGAVYITVESHPNTADARDDYEMLVDIWVTRTNVTQPDGPWEQIEHGTDDHASGSFALTTVAMDGNLVILVNWYGFGTAGNTDGASDASLALIEDILELTSV